MELSGSSVSHVSSEEEFLYDVELFPMTQEKNKYNELSFETTKCSKESIFFKDLVNLKVIIFPQRNLGDMR